MPQPLATRTLRTESLPDLIPQVQYRGIPASDWEGGDQLLSSVIACGSLDEFLGLLDRGHAVFAMAGAANRVQR